MPLAWQAFIFSSCLPRALPATLRLGRNRNEVLKINELLEPPFSIFCCWRMAKC